MDSDEEIPLDSEEESNSYNCSGDDVTAEEEAAAAEEYCSHQSKKDYTVLKEEMIKQLQENDISEVSGVLSVSRGTACTLLLRQSWTVSSVFEDWFSDEERLRKSIGKEISPKPENYCKICMENVDIETMLSAACGHLFCSDCWRSHVSISINDGAGCLWLHCPEPKCEAVAGLDMVESVAADDEKQIYYKYLRRSYVELSKNRKWCPAPGCDAAVEFDVGGGESYDVSCNCSYKFCWSCTEEAHRPVSCSTVAKWLEKNTSEAENINWIMAFTKPCPKCKTKIEKNHGCNHMTCSKPCGFEFCWLCLETWTGYSHRCNKFGREDEASSVEASRKELVRYSHYFERWISNHRSRNVARADLARARDEHVPLLLRVQGRPGLDLQFVVEAWDQVVECRRVLKWSYAYGFYVEAGKKVFFEYLQGGAEAALERLHHCVENEMKRYVEAKAALDGFGEFCRKLKSLTKVTRNYFENLVRAFENDLCEVDGSSSGSRCHFTRPSKKQKTDRALSV